MKQKRNLKQVIQKYTCQALIVSTLSSLALPYVNAQDYSNEEQEDRYTVEDIIDYSAVNSIYNHDLLPVIRAINLGETEGLVTEMPEFHPYMAEFYYNMAQNRLVVHSILNKIIVEGMSETDKIKAVYDFIMYNFVRYDTDRESHAPDYMRTWFNQNMAVPMDSGTYLLSSGIGGCGEFSSLFERLVSTLGFDCFLDSGSYINRDGSELFHIWNRAKVNDTWFWYDVDVEGSVYRRGDVASPLYYLYQKNTSDWYTNHSWDETYTSVMEQAIDRIEFYQSGDIIAYPMETTVKVKGEVFQSSHPLLSYVDRDTLFESESVMLLPFWDIIDCLGMGYAWNADSRCLEVYKADDLIEFPLGGHTYFYNGMECLMTIPLQVVNDIDYINMEDVGFLFDMMWSSQFYEDDSVVKLVVHLQ